MNISAAQVKELRDKTGAGMMECKKALGETEGDVQKAIDYLREQLGVLVEINCETDFVARTEDFKMLGKNVAMQVAASAPQFVSRDQVSEDVLEHEREVVRAQAKAEGKPDKILDKIVEGRIEKYFQEICLLDQAYIRDDSKKVQDLVTETIAKIRENITIKRFMRFKVGE
jgi:elongation factor Ts